MKKTADKIKTKKHHNVFRKKVKLKCTENNVVLEAELLTHTPAYMMTCLVDKKIHMNLRYNTADKVYVGRVGKLEFTSSGPEK